MTTIGFIGLGKLGLPVALAVESRGFDVVGYDVNPDVRQYIARRSVPYRENGLRPLLDTTRLVMLESIEAVVRASDIVFCAVQTPHRREFEGDMPLTELRADFDYGFLVKAVKEVAQAAEALDKQTTLVVISTCLPGTYRREIAPLLTDKICYVYNPFFIAMGTVIDDFLAPEFVLIGCESISSEKVDTVAAVREFYKQIHKIPQYEIGNPYYRKVPRLFITDITTAEGIKVFYNTFITAKIVLGNLYGEMAHKCGMNVDDIHDALALATDRLISPKYLRAGVGDGGACHPRDCIALSWLAGEVDLSFDFFNSLMHAREEHMRWLAVLFVREMEDTGLRGIILGRAFKPESNIEIGSAAILLAHLAREMVGASGDFSQYEFDYPDPLPIAVYFIATQHQAYRSILFPYGSVVIDPFRYIPERKGVRVISIGGGQRDECAH